MGFIRKRIRNGTIYLEEVENIRKNGKIVQKFIRHLGKEVNSEKILTTNFKDITIQDVKVHGPLLIFNQAAIDLKLNKILGKYSNEILSMVFSHCLNPKSLTKMEQWYKKTDLNCLLDLPDITESKLLTALDSLVKLDEESLQLKIFSVAQKKLNLNKGGIIYDVTNTYLYGKKCPIAKKGKDKRGVRGSNIIQIGLGVTKKESFPVFHKVYDGNINDSKTLKDLVLNFKKLNVARGLIVFDRGITSEGNVTDLMKIGWDSICGLKSNNTLKNILRNINKDDLCVISNRIKTKSTIFYALKIKYSLGKVKGNLIICYDEMKAKRMKESRFDEIELAKNSLKRKKCLKEGIEIYFNSNGSLNHKKIIEMESYDGFSFIFSTDVKICTTDIIKIYFSDKDLIEKSFKCIKGVAGLRPIRHWLYDRVKAHILICYLSFTILSYLKIKLEMKNFTLTQSIEELSTAYKVYLNDFKKGISVSKIVCLTKNQEKILRAINYKLAKV